MKREYYSDSIANFRNTTSNEILGRLTRSNDFPLEQTQRDAWLEEINILQKVLSPFQGAVYFEYSIPRMGRRIDVVVLIGPTIFVLEFKIGEKEFTASAINQVWDYGLDLKNFHESSHGHFIAPVLIASQAENVTPVIAVTPQNDNLLFPIKCNVELLSQVIEDVLLFSEGTAIDPIQWESGRYCPTPTIIEAAMALYNGHSVSDISRSDASAINLSETSEAISEIIRSSKNNSHKSICFVTGVPGAGKTLVGLNIATRHIDKDNDLYSVFLSGNGPLVAILREALARDKVRHEKERGRKIKKGEAMREVKMFIQNVHHFRDDCLIDLNKPPIEHVALFDEAQRAWNLQQTANFMRQNWKIQRISLSFTTRPLNIYEKSVSRLFEPLARFARWQKLLERGQTGLLDEAAMRGLIGELLFLEKQAIPSRGLREAVNGWVGPSGAQRDFRFPEHEYEIKTIRTGANRVLISSAEQLDLPLKLLDLFIVVLDEAELGSHPDAFTPLALVGRLREFMESDLVALEGFEARLMDAGFVAREEYGERAYLFRQFRMFRVSEGFPAIRRSDLPVGIGKVSWELEIPAILAFELNPAMT